MNDGNNNYDDDGLDIGDIVNIVRDTVSLLGNKVALIVVLVFLIVVLVLMFGYILFMSASAFFMEGGAMTYEKNGYGTAEIGEATYEEWWYDPQNALDNLDDIINNIDPNSDGYSYIDKKNIKRILEKVIEYRDDEHTMRSANNTYKYYYHYWDWEVHYVYSETDPDTGDQTITTEYSSTDIEDKERTSVVLNHTVEDDPIFAVSWEEIYVMAAMKSVVEEGNNGIWENNATANGIRTVSRLDDATIDDIINSFTYNFTYNFDPTLPPYNDPNYVFEYDDMESFAYIYVPQGTNVEHGTEVVGQTPSFEYREVKIPSIAPAYGANCYELVEYVYDQSGYLQGRWITIDGQEFYNYAKGIIGDDFEMAWFRDMIMQMPGAYYDNGSGCLADKYQMIYDSYISGQPVSYFDDTIPGVGTIQLGGGCPQYDYDPSTNNGLFSDNSSYYKTGAAYTPITCGNELVDYAQQFLGNPYVWGGNSLTNGCDCSGFVKLIYEQYGMSLPRKSSAIAGVCQRVPMGDVQPGDLLFRTTNGSNSGVVHVAIVIGIENGEYVTVEAMGAKWGICIGRRSTSRGDLFVARPPQ